MTLPYRVLDLTDERGQLTGQILSDLGADVILVEPPGGSQSRRIAPVVDGHEDDPEHSLWFWAYNRGKRSITLDVDDPADRATLAGLAQRPAATAPGPSGSPGRSPRCLAHRSRSMGRPPPPVPTVTTS